MDNSDKKLTDGGSKPPFIHLHIHSEYSLVDSIIRIKTLIAKAQKFHMPAIAMTDQSNLFGMVKFYQAAIAAGVKPIVGVDATIRIEDSANPTSRLVMLCKDYEGYLNLSRLVSRAYQEGQNQGVPHISIDWLNGHTNGLIALSGGRDGDIGP